MRLMVGVPDYEAYLNHMKAVSPKSLRSTLWCQGRLNRCC
jgi:uncharacterized short protein YbdD (DUF466 family)